MSSSENDLDETGEQTRKGSRRPRMLAGGTLGLAGIGAGLVLALSGGAASAQTTKAVHHTSANAVTVEIDSGATYASANKLLAAQDNENVSIDMAQGAATTQGAVACTPRIGLGAPKGPAVSVLIGRNGTEYPQQSMPNTGATGAYHLVSCRYGEPGPGGVALGNSGNTGS